MKLNQFFRNTFSFSNLHLLRMVRVLFSTVLIIAITSPIYGQKKFFKAISKGDVEAVASYISKGGDLNTQKELWSYDAYYDKDTTHLFAPMEIAALQGELEILRLLIQHKESIKDYQNCLDKAFGVSIASGNMKMINLLIDAGADINAKCSTCYGQSAIQIALEYSNFELVEKLMNLGAELKVSSNMGRTPLHAVAHSDNTLLAEKLINSGLDMEALDEDGATPIVFAAGNGKLEMLKLFEKHGANLHIIENGGSDLMMNAVIGENVDLIAYLIEKKLEINDIDNEGWTPLLLACSENYTKIVETLIQASAEVEVMNYEGETPLLWAIWNSASC